MPACSSRSTTRLGIDLLHDLHRITCGFKIGDRRSLVFVVEGRFKPERFPEAVKQLATEHAGSFRHLKAGDHDVWQVPDNADGAYLALLDDRTLVLTASKDGMDGVLARFAGKKKDGLSAGLRTLLAGCEKEHVGLMLNHADTFANDAARFLEQEVVKGLDPGDTVTRLALGQAEGLIRHYGSDFSSLSLAISLGTEETRLQFGAETRKAERATELGQLAQTGNLAGALRAQGSQRRSGPATGRHPAPCTRRSQGGDGNPSGRGAARLRQGTREKPLARPGDAE